MSTTTAPAARFIVRKAAGKFHVYDTVDRCRTSIRPAVSEGLAQSTANILNASVALAAAPAPRF